MTDTDTHQHPRKKLRTWLWNPFTLIAGVPALVAGIGFMLLTGFIAFGTKTHFDGVLDTHVGFKAPLWFFLAESFINWISLALVLLASAFILASGRNFRAIDLLGTQALARWPFLIIALATYTPGFTSFTQKLNNLVVKGQIVFPDTSATEMSAFAFVSLVMIVVTVWFVALAWKSFRISCDISGGKAVITFIVGIIIAEVISKVVFLQLVALSRHLTEGSA